MGASLEYFTSGASDPARVKVKLLRVKETGGRQVVKKIRGSVEPGGSPYFKKTNAALATLSPNAIEANDFFMRTQDLGEGLPQEEDEDD